jgi:hypothetical protein
VVRVQSFTSGWLFRGAMHWQGSSGLIGHDGLGSKCQEQPLQLAALPRAQQFDGMGAVSLEGVEAIRLAVWAYATVAVIKRVALDVKRDHPAIALDRHRPAIAISPGLIAQAAHGADTRGDVFQDL